MNISMQIQKHLTDAATLASKEVQRLAREALQKYPDLNEFVMAMGTWYFTLKIDAMDHHGILVTPGNDIIHESCDDPRFKDIDDFVNKWDNELKITGEPMRFTATGPRRSNW